MKKPKAKERILGTAADLFAERGYGSVGINEIIEKSETAKASFYHHFPSKENLCITWLEETHARSDARHEAILSAPGSAADKLVGYFSGLKDWMQQKDFRGCPYTNTTASLDKESPEIAEQVELHKQSIRDFLIDLAREITASGSRARKLGTHLFLLYSGATTEAQNLRSNWPIDAAIECVNDLIAQESAANSSE
ncbi:MAG: AcrR family transcriptional regulator [Verrucomicrobiales bacterium]|jgi:AcrR family transcriptional regulator